MRDNPETIAFLNKALKNELTAINQYFLHSRMLKDWGITKLAKKEYEESIEEMEMKIRGRGNSTWALHPKKPYQLKLESKRTLFGMPSDKKWLFLAEYSDKTLIRNRLAFELGRLSTLRWTPSGHFAIGGSSD